MTSPGQDHKIRDYIFQKINQSSLDSPQRLPSENQIAQLFKVSRHTVRRLYDSLEEMGVLVSKQGVGRFANKGKPEIYLPMNSVSFTKKMEDQGVPLETKNLGLLKVEGQEVQNFLKKGLEETVFGVRRLRILHGHPAAIHISYVSSQTLPQIEEEGDQITSMTQYYQSKGIESTESKDTKISIRFPTSEDMKILECKSLVPLLIAHSMVYDKRQRLLELTEIIYRSDIFEYNI